MVAMNWEQIFFIVIFVSSWIFAGYTVINNWKLARTGAPYEVKTTLSFKIKSVLTNVLFQKKLFKNPLRGIFHLFVFAGFFVYSLHTLSQFINGLSGGSAFYLPQYIAHFLGSWFYVIYENILDIFSFLVLSGLLFFFNRRYIFKAPELDRPSWQSIIILSMIALLMVSTLLETSAMTAIHGGSPAIIRTEIAFLFWSNLNFDQLVTIYRIGWWGHIVSVLLFLVIIPKSKHAHLIWAPVNFWFLPNTPRGKMADMDIENNPIWGANSIHEFTWKNHLDALSCIECGRCQLSCPASRTGKELSPKNIMTGLKHSLLDLMPQTVQKLKSGVEKDSLSESGEFKIIDKYIHTNSLWSCTSCYACVESCPVGNNQLEVILQARRSVVLNDGAMPSQLQLALTNMENQSNPWGISNEKREEWAQGLNVRTMRDFKEKGDTPEYLYWVGCAGAFDERNKKVARSLVSILNKSGVTFGILGTEESCTGDSARRAGNEYLFQSLAQTNIEKLNGYGVKKIVTACPHCFNTLKNEYPGFGGNYEVVHHSELIEQLLDNGKIDSRTDFKKKVTYHDSCYLGRYNQKYDAPRSSITRSGGELTEAAEHKQNGMCCGAGGAQMWMEEMGTERINLKRTNDLLKTGSEVISTACPFCLTMVSDGVKSVGSLETTPVLDIAEIVAGGN